MTWSQFWEQPTMSYGEVAFLAFCFWLVKLIERPSAARREEAIRRYNETHPFGDVETRYEVEYGRENEGDA